MTEFTLATALSYLKKNLLITSILIIAVYYIFSTFPIFDNRYQMSKTIIIGSHPPNFAIRLLDKDSIELMLGSSEFRNMLINNHGIDETVNFKVNIHNHKRESIVGIFFQGTNIEGIVNVANILLKELKKIDAPLLNEKIDYIKKQISIKKDRIQGYASFDNSKILTKGDIKQFAEFQKTFDEFYAQDANNNSVLSSQNTGVATVNLSRFKREQVVSEIENIQKIANMEEEVLKLESTLKDFEEISYLLPTSSASVSRVFPNQLVFIGISLFVAVFYNLIMLSYYFQKHNK